MFQKTARREAAEFLEELRSEKLRGVGEAQSAAIRFRMIGQAFRDDETGFFRSPAFAKKHGAGFFDAIDVGLRDEAAHLAVEIF